MFLEEIDSTLINPLTSLQMDIHTNFYSGTLVLIPEDRQVPEVPNSIFWPEAEGVLKQLTPTASSTLYTESQTNDE